VHWKIPATIVILMNVNTLPGNAASQQDWAMCRDTENIAELDRNIGACTNILSDRNLSGNDRATALDRRCRMLGIKHDLDGALADCNQAIAINPNDAGVYVNRASAWGGKNEIDHALADLAKAIAINPNEFSAYNNRSRILRGRGELDRAAADLTNSIRISPNSFYAYRERGVIRLSKGDFASAADDLGHATDLAKSVAATNGSFPHVIIYRYLARARLGEDAVPELRTNASLMAHKSWPVPMIELYLGGRSPEDALAAAGTPGDHCEAEFYVGEWNLVHGNRDAAKQHLKAAVDTCPHSFGEYLIAAAELKRPDR
jgi:tetratricopeptide (TPR) repeat protein